MNNKIIIAACAVMMSSTAMAEKKATGIPDGVAKPTSSIDKIDSLQMLMLQEVQVVSTRATKKTPVAYADISKAAIKELNYGKDLPEVLQLTPSITTTSDAGNGIGYTTMRVRGSDPSRINVTVNGIPLNDAESSSVFWVNFNDIVSSAQSIQIQRGVGTSTNGAGAFGATVNLLTENVGTNPFIGVDLSAGSYASFKTTLRFGTGLIKNHWGIQGRFSNISSEGYLDRASTKLRSYFLQAGYFGDNTVVKFITYNGKEKTYHAWNYTSKYEQAMYGRTYNSCGIMSYDAAGNPFTYYDGQTDNYMSNNFQLIWNQRFSNVLNLNVAAHYTHGNGYYEEYKIGADLYNYGLSKAWDTYYSDLVRQQKMLNDFYGFTAALNYDNKKNLSFNFGGGWNQYNGDNYGLVTLLQYPGDVAYTQDFKYYDNNAMKSDYNIYAKATYEFFKGFSAYIDMQYRGVKYNLQDPIKSYYDNNGARRSTSGEYVLQNTYNFFNPKFGLNYDINSSHRVYVSYAISHKEPVRNNFQEYYAVAEQGINTTYPKAERLGDLEFGYKFQSQKFSAGFNFYWMDYKDQFVLTGALNEIGEALTANLDKSYRLGVEFEAGWKVCDWFRWDLNGTWSRNRVKDITVTLDNGSDYVIKGESPLSFSPDLILNNIFTFNYKGFKAAIQSNYVSSQFLNNTGFAAYNTLDDNGNPVEVSMKLGGHFTTNLDLSYNFALKQFRMKDVTVGITFYNLFSSKYDNNGWSYCQYKLEDGQLMAYNGSFTRNADGTYSGYGDQYEAGFAPSAPFNFMAHVSVNF